MLTIPNSLWNQSSLSCIKILMKPKLPAGLYFCSLLLLKQLHLLSETLFKTKKQKCLFKMLKIWILMLNLFWEGGNSYVTYLNVSLNKEIDLIFFRLKMVKICRVISKFLKRSIFILPWIQETCGTAGHMSA